MGKSGRLGVTEWYPSSGTLSRVSHSCVCRLRCGDFLVCLLRKICLTPRGHRREDNAAQIDPVNPTDLLPILIDNEKGCLFLCTEIELSHVTQQRVKHKQREVAQ